MTTRSFVIYCPICGRRIVIFETTSHCEVCRKNIESTVLSIDFDIPCEEGILRDLEEKVYIAEGRK